MPPLEACSLTAGLGAEVPTGNFTLQNADGDLAPRLFVQQRRQELQPDCTLAPVGAATFDDTGGPDPDDTDPTTPLNCIGVGPFWIPTGDGELQDADVDGVPRVLIEERRHDVSAGCTVTATSEVRLTDTGVVDPDDNDRNAPVPTDLIIEGLAFVDDAVLSSVNLTKELVNGTLDFVNGTVATTLALLDQVDDLANETVTNSTTAAQDLVNLTLAFAQEAQEAAGLLIAAASSNAMTLEAAAGCAENEMLVYEGEVQARAEAFVATPTPEAFDILSNTLLVGSQLMVARIQDCGAESTVAQTVVNAFASAAGLVAALSNSTDAFLRGSANQTEDVTAFILNGTFNAIVGALVASAQTVVGGAEALAVTTLQSSGELVEHIAQSIVVQRLRETAEEATGPEGEIPEGSARLRFVVVDSIGAPVEGVRVEIFRGAIEDGSASTNDAGEALFTVLPETQFEYLVTRMGFAQERGTATSGPEGTTTRIDVELVGISTAGIGFELDASLLLIALLALVLGVFLVRRIIGRRR